MAHVKLGRHLMGLGNIEICSMRSLDDWYKDIQRLKRRFPKHPVLSSILHSNRPSKEQWQYLAKWSEDAGCDGIEMNLGCSHGMAEHGGGAAIGRNTDAITEVVSWVTEVVDIPVIVKLPAAPAMMGRLARAAKAGGAQGITTINSVPSLLGIDLDTFSPLPATSDGGSFGGYSGAAVKPIALRCVAEVHQAVDLPIMACGGITDWKTAAEHLLAGGTCLQVCTTVMEHGFRVVRAIKMGLVRYLQEKGLQNVQELTGRVLPKLRVHTDLPTHQRLVVQINEDTCIKCGRCVVSCEDSAYQAFDWAKGTVPIVHAQHCDGCSLCIHVCPVDDCITMVPTDIPYVERRAG